MAGATPSGPLADAREFEQHMEAFVAKEERPLLHLTPRVGWMNDPNGFSYYQGAYHLFYQYNPYKAAWAPMHWGHAVSRDLVSWTYLPCAMAPDQPYDDKGGCFSGSAVELPDGRHLLMYTGVASDGANPDGTIRDVQTQCLAIGDGTNYEKYDRNPVIDGKTLPEGSSTEHFRDPKIWRDADGTYRVVLANLAADKSGQIVMYKSVDGFDWSFDRVLARNAWRFGTMWECPDFFSLDGKDVLLVSPQDMLAESHRFHAGNGTLCLIGQVDEQTGELVEETAEAIDYGTDFYATQTTLTPDGRRVMVAWMQNWDSTTNISDSERWFGQMTLPRELSLRNGHLYQWPVRELEAWRAHAVAHSDVVVGDEPIALEGVRGRVIDLSVDVRPADAEHPFEEFVICFAQNERFRSTIRFRPGSGTLKLSRVHAGSRRAFVHRCTCEVPSDEGKLSLRIILDKRSVEVFVNGGEKTLTMTIPTELSADAITFFSQGGAVMDVEKFDLVNPASADAR
jgi:beta-fructofuranosidase